MREGSGYERAADATTTQVCRNSESPTFASAEAHGLSKMGDSFCERRRDERAAPARQPSGCHHRWHSAAGAFAEPLPLPLPLPPTLIHPLIHWVAHFR